MESIHEPPGFLIAKFLFGTDDFNLKVIRTGKAKQPKAGGRIPAVITGLDSVCFQPRTYRSKAGCEKRQVLGFRNGFMR